MSMKITILIGLTLSAAIVIQTARLSNAHEELGAQSTALKVTNAKLEARESLDLALNEIKTTIVTNRAVRQQAEARRMALLMEELGDVKKHECFTNRSTIPVEYVRVLNNRSASGAYGSD